MAKNISTVILLLFFVSCKQTNEQMTSKGIKLYNKEKYKEAIGIYTNVLNNNSKLQLAYYYRGLCYIETKEYLKALNDFNSIINLKTLGGGNFIWELNPNSIVADE